MSIISTLDSFVKHSRKKVVMYKLLYMAKHSRGKTFVVRIENECSRETFIVATPFYNEYLLLLVNYSTYNIRS